jgi:TolB-like protein/DNA-binding winged helix-turn-helix (wHTH) protein/Tfp pilus assembly protein PilF
VNPAIPMSPKGLYEFGPFRLDSSKHLLLKDTKALPLPPKAFEILVLLVEKRGTLMAKGDLLHAVWPDTFVEENNLTQYVSMLRKVLGDGVDDQKYIQTVPKLGYRFIFEVREISDGESDLVLARHTQTRIVVREEKEEEIAVHDVSAVPAEEHLPAVQPRRRPVLVWISGGLAAITLLLVGVYSHGRHTVGGSATNPQRIRSLAVLPFKNLSGDPGQDFFVDAMTDALITDLAQIRDLRVISGTSAMHYKDTHKALPEIALELNVDGVVEGTVFRSGDQLRITAQLVEAASDKNLWARSYERDLRDVIRLQDQVARDIAAEIKVKLTPQEQIRLTSASPVNTEAYQLFLQGQYFETKVTEDFLRKAVATLQQSIAEDPNYAPAHNALALAYESLATSGYESPLSQFPKAKAELSRALELDDSLADAHLNLAQIKLTFDWDWSGADHEMQRAFESNPSIYATGGGRGLYFLTMGRFDDAIAEYRRARALNPIDLDASLYVGQFFLLAGRYDESMVEFKKTLELDPNFLPAHAELALAYTRAGKLPEATTEYQKTRSLMAPRQALILDQWMAPVEILLGKRAESLKNADWWARESAHRHIDACILAAFYAELGFKDRAFQWLDIGFEQRSPSMAYLKIDANFPVDMRGDSRFQDLLRRMNFPH